MDNSILESMGIFDPGIPIIILFILVHEGKKSREP